MELNIAIDVGKNYIVRTADDVFCGALRAVIKRDDGKNVLLFTQEKWRIIIDDNVLSVANEKGKIMSNYIETTLERIKDAAYYLAESSAELEELKKEIQTLKNENEKLQENIDHLNRVIQSDRGVQ